MNNIKRITSIIYLILLPIFIYAQSYSGGSGTEASPYQINNKTDLKYLSENSGEWTKHFVQTSNISFDESDFQNGGDFYNSGYGFIPIGNSSNSFSGSYDGDGFAIHNLLMNRSSSNYIGLFGYLNSADINNLSLYNTNISGYQYVGSLAGYLSGTTNISNCMVTGEVDGYYRIGGVIGYDYMSGVGQIQDSYFHGTVTADGTNSGIGGFIGEKSGNSIIQRCGSSGTVSASGRNCGGFVGWIDEGEINYCFTSVDVSSTTTTGRVGGFTGAVAYYQGRTGEVNNCFAIGDVTATNAVSGTYGVGGFNGSYYENGENTITNSFAAGKVNTTTSYKGGFSGEGKASGTMPSGNYWNTTTSGLSTSAATGETGINTAQMQSQGTFSGWDFTNTWKMSESFTFYGFPCLEWTKSYEAAPTSSQIADLSNLVWILADNSRWSNSYSYVQTDDIEAIVTYAWDKDFSGYPSTTATPKGWTPICDQNASPYFYGGYNGDSYIINNLYINRPTEAYNGFFGLVFSAQDKIKNIGLTNVNISGNSETGALAGRLKYANNCFTTGNVTAGSNASEVGGFAGNIEKTVEYCYSNTNVQAGSGCSKIGSFIGEANAYYSSNDVLINNCYATGDVTGDATFAGGFAGYINHSEGSLSINNCYSAGSVNGTSTGGFSAASSGSPTVNNCFWDTETSDQSSSSAGTGKTTSEMKTQTTFTNWDFSSPDIWDIENPSTNYISYPYLHTNTQSPPPGYQYILLTWDGSVSNDWNTPGNWDMNTVPDNTKNIIITTNGTAPIIEYDETADCNNLTISSGATLTIEDGGSLIINGSVTNNGTFNTEKGFSFDRWYLISSPVSNATSAMFEGHYLQNWNESTGTWTDIESLIEPLTPLKGFGFYGIMESKPPGQTFTFSGTPNIGEQTKTLSWTNVPGDEFIFDGASLLGNPYTSSFNWSQLDDTWGAVYYWDATIGDEGDWASWNDGEASNFGTQYIPPMQGFFIVVDEADNGSIFTVNTSNQTHSGATNFFKNDQNLENGVRLLTRWEDYQSDLVIKFNENASVGFDKIYDAYRFSTNSLTSSQIYTLEDNIKMSIDVRPETEIIQLGFKNQTNGQYSIELAEIDGITAELEDTKLNKFHDLSQGAYSFNWNTTDSEERFILHLKATGTDDLEAQQVQVYAANGQVYIRLNELDSFDQIMIYDLAGRLMFKTEIENQTLQSFDLNHLHGSYMVQLLSTKEQKTFKVVL